MTDFCAYIKRNKRKFIYVAGIISSGYAIYKVTSYVQSLANKHQTNKNLQFKIHKAQYFQAMLINSFDTIKSILKNLEHEIEKAIDLENVATSLGITLSNSIQSTETNKQQYASFSTNKKLDLWQKLKVLSFTKLTLLIYCWSFISISIHIQMAILAGNMFHTKNSYRNFNTILAFYKMIFPYHNNKLLDEKFQLEFINFTLKQIQFQMCKWAELIHKVTNKVVGSISLKATLTPDDILGIVGQIKESVHNDILETFLHNIQSQATNKLAEAKIFEIFSNVFESSGIGHVNSLITTLSKQVCTFLDQKMRSNKMVDAENETIPKAPLAKLVPFLWISFISDENKMLNSIHDFSCDSQFRFMLYNSYESGMETLNE